MPDENPKNEITNAVLKATIDGLAKLTDTQLGYVNETLKDLKSLMGGFATKIEIEEVKKDFNASLKRVDEKFDTIAKGFAQHNLDDKESFRGLNQGQKEVRDTLLKWGAIFGSFLFIISFLSPFILKYIFKF